MRIHSTYARAVTRRMDMTLGEASHGPTRVRDFSLQNRIAPHVSAPCQRKQCYSCTSLNCTCPCGHGGGGRSR
jgi:hypothetical protein